MLELLNRNEAAVILRVHPITLFKWAQAGWIPTIRIGPKMLRFYKIDVVSLAKKLHDIDAPRGGSVARDFRFPSRF